MYSLGRALKARELIDDFVHKHSRLPTETDPDYLEMLRMTKYRLLAVPDFKPGKCGNCGSSKNDGRGYVDFGLEVDWYGTVYLCGHCLTDIAKAMGLFKELEAKVEELEVKDEVVKKLIDRGVELHETVERTFKEFEEFYASLPTFSNYTSSDSTPSVVATEATAIESSTIPVVDSSKHGTDEAKSRVAKSTSGSRRTNVPSLTELLNKPDD